MLLPSPAKTLQPAANDEAQIEFDRRFGPHSDLNRAITVCFAMG